MFLTKMAQAIAIVLSAAAGIISVIGLASIFSGAYYAVLAIASILEVAKVITAAWLHANWRTISAQLKFYLSLAVVVLMLITSLGIYGFLARAHIKQQLAIETSEITRLPSIESKIQIEKDKVSAIDRQVRQVDDALSTMANKGRARDAKQALDEAKKQRKDREQFLRDKAASLDLISQLENEKLRVISNNKELEAEIGPLRYIADFIKGSESNKTEKERAVQWLMLVLIFVFDPLAIFLIMATNSSFEFAGKLEQRRTKIQKRPGRPPGSPSGQMPRVGNPGKLRIVSAAAKKLPDKKKPKTPRVPRKPTPKKPSKRAGEVAAIIIREHPRAKGEKLEPYVVASSMPKKNFQSSGPHMIH